MDGGRLVLFYTTMDTNHTFVAVACSFSVDIDFI